MFLFDIDLFWRHCRLKPLNMSTSEQITALNPLTLVGLPTGRYLGGFRLTGGTGRRRLLGHNKVNIYHVMSRTVGGDFLLGDLEKEGLRKIMRRLERFSGVQVLTYAIMSNHFHLLVRVPEREKFVAQFEGEGGEEKFFEHLSLLYSKDFIRALRCELNSLKKQGPSMEAAVAQLIDRFYQRFCDLSSFVKELKERFSRWYNKLYARRGTLWMDRYKSVIVEDGEALRTMAAYIDLNPVRAGLCQSPSDYRWCGYAEAIAGSKRARRGLCRVLNRPLDSWFEAPKASALCPADSYQKLLGLKPQPTEEQSLASAPPSQLAQPNKHLASSDQRASPAAANQSAQPTSKPNEPESTEFKTPPLSRAELIRCRVRYFTEGLALGSEAFIESLFNARRSHFGRTRRSGAKGIPESQEKIFSIRRIRQRPIQMPGKIEPTRQNE